MKKLLPACLLLGALTTLQKNAQAQNWQLVWQDEFTNGISSDWVFETGNGSSGWGNNELEYYRRENATIENGQLVITAKRESFGGFNYTSARMKTQGNRSWKYGKFEARIKMPAFSGIWPAFWMLGNTISDPNVGWPACGEIDIMEHINAENRTYGTPHWRDHNNNYASYGGNTFCTVTDYHIYSVEWDANYIRWFLDGAKFHEMYIGGGINGTSEFHANHFLLLNMAVGGNWPGFNIDLNGFPAKMYVDYVRVYQDGGGNPNPEGQTIQAESFTAQSGVQTETTTDAGGGSNVGWIDANDWMAYGAVTFPATGTYKVEYRVASLNGGGRLSLDLNAGATVLGQLDVPSTGGWQNWTTISHNVQINAGTYNPGIFAVAGGWNLNWIRFTPVSARIATNTEMVNNLIDNSVQSGKGFTIYPNPVQQKLNILSGESLTGGLIRIFDISGRQVITARAASNNVDVSSLAPGVYTLVFTKGKTKITREFIK